MANYHVQADHEELKMFNAHLKGARESFKKIKESIGNSLENMDWSDQKGSDLKNKFANEGVRAFDGLIKSIDTLTEYLETKIGDLERYHEIHITK